MKKFIATINPVVDEIIVRRLKKIGYTVDTIIWVQYEVLDDSVFDLCFVLDEISMTAQRNLLHICRKKNYHEINMFDLYQIKPSEER